MNLMGNKTDLSDPVGTAAEALCRYCEVIYSQKTKKNFSLNSQAMHIIHLY